MLKFLTLSLFFCGFVADASPYQSFYAYKLQEFEQMSNTKRVFLGDSLTMRHNWSGFKAANMGIDGDTTAGVLRRIHQTHSADTIVLMIGVNDILNQLPLITIQKNYMKIFKSFTSDQKVYLLSLLPVIDDKQTKTINQQIRTLNRWLKEEVKKHDISFIDLYPLFLNSSETGLDRQFTSDGIHLTSKAYTVWEGQIKKVLTKD